jgi:ubiquinone/menaquinone biosynthesis C-methylase UbiE
MMSEKKLIEFFDKISERYAKNSSGEIEDLIRERTYEEVNKIIKSFKEKNKEIKILEAGCGNGWLTSKLLRFENVKITAVDFSRGMLKELEKRLKKDYGKEYNKIKNRLKIINSNLLNLEIKEKYDLIILINVLVNVRNKKEVDSIIKRLSSLLRKNKLLILSIKNKNSFFALSIATRFSILKVKKFPVKFYELKFIKEILVKSGLKIKSVLGIKLKKNPLPLNLKPKNIIKKTKILLKDKKQLKETIMYILRKIMLHLDIILKINSAYLIVAKK